MNYDPSKIKVTHGSNEWFGYNEDGIQIEYGKPFGRWWNIVELPKDHIRYIEGTTRLEITTKGVIVGLSIKNDSGSLEYIKSLDPYNHELSEMFIDGVEVSSDNFKELVNV